MFGVALAGLGVLAAPATSFGQGTTSRGLFGDRTIGSFSSAGSSSAFGSSPTTGANSTGSSYGSRADLGTQRFTRQIQQPGQRATFVGSDTGDIPDFLSALQGGGQTGTRGQSLRGGTSNLRGGTSGLGGLSSLRRNGTTNQQGMNRGGMGGMGRSQVDVRNTLSVGFQASQPNLPDLAQTLTRRFQASNRIRFLQPANVTTEGSVVVLQGSVASEHDRALAEQLARLEPGVWDVRNELVVGGQTGDSSSGSATLPAAAPAASPFVPE